MTKTSAQTVTVRLATGQQLEYGWATSVRLDRRGDLRVLDGWKQRAYHPASDWLSYTVQNPRRDQEASRSRPLRARPVP